MHFTHQHVLSVDQFRLEHLQSLLATAKALDPIMSRECYTKILEGALLSNLFFEASTRTRMSFCSAFERLGGSVSDTTGFTFSSISKGESLYDTGRVISGYSDAIVMRHPEVGAVAELAQACHVPVINGGDGPAEHPTQALLDWYTIEAGFEPLKKSIQSAHFLFVGDLKYGRTVHSLLKLLCLYPGASVTLAAPESLSMPSYLVEHARSCGLNITETQSIRDGVKDVDLIYATRIQKERFENGESVEGYARDFLVNKHTMDTAFSPDTVVMHPLPRDSRPGANDLSNDLNDDPRLAIFRQTDNGLRVRMALFALVMGVENALESSFQTPRWSRSGATNSHTHAKLSP